MSDDVEFRIGLAPGHGEGVEVLAQPPGRFDEIPPPVIGEDVEDGAARAGLALVAVEPRLSQQAQKVRVLGEAEKARDEGIDAYEAEGAKGIAAGRQGELLGKSKVVVAEDITHVEPGLGPVRPLKTAAHDAGQDDGGGQVGVLARFPQQFRAETPARLERVIQVRARDAGHDAAREVQERPMVALPSIPHDRIVAAHRRPRPVQIRTRSPLKTP